MIGHGLNQRRYKCIVFYHWLKLFTATNRKHVLVAFLSHVFLISPTVLRRFKLPGYTCNLNLQANVSATVRLFGGDSSHTPFFYWQSFQGNTLHPLAIIHMKDINVLDFDDKSERNLCFFFGNLGIIFNGASAHLFSAQGEMVIRLGQRSPTGQWRQRLIDADCCHLWEPHIFRLSSCSIIFDKKVISLRGGLKVKS